MLERIRPRSVYDVLAVVGFFVAVATGGAYAANTVFSEDIVNGEVKKADIASGAVGVEELEPGAVTSGRVKDDELASVDVKNNSLKGADIDESSLSSIGGGGPAGGDLTGTYPNPSIASDAVGSAEVAGNSLNGFDIDESTLGPVPQAVLGGLGRYSGTAPVCDPESATGISCAETTIDLPADTSVLVIGTVKAQGGGTGQCQLNHHGNGIFERLVLSGFDAGNGTAAQFVPLIAITQRARRGGSIPSRFELECNELAGEIVHFDPRVVAVALSPN